MRHFRELVCALSLMGMIATTGNAQEISAPNQAVAAQREENAQQKLVHEAAQLLSEGSVSEALARLDEAISSYEERFGASKKKVYSARSTVEVLMYMAEAAQAKTDAVAVESEYGYAYYLKAYVLIELQRREDALNALQKAVALSPRNAQFLAELGNIHQTAKDWPRALEVYQEAESAAEFSPEDVKAKELGRALRGIGYVFIETGRYDEAEAIYRRCLKIDPGDATAARELEYVRQLRTRQEGEPRPIESAP